MISNAFRIEKWQNHRGIFPSACFTFYRSICSLTYFAYVFAILYSKKLWRSWFPIPCLKSNSKRYVSEDNRLLQHLQIIFEKNYFLGRTAVDFQIIFRLSSFGCRTIVIWSGKINVRNLMISGIDERFEMILIMHSEDMRQNQNLTWYVKADHNSWPDYVKLTLKWLDGKWKNMCRVHWFRSFCISWFVQSCRPVFILFFEGLICDGLLNYLILVICLHQVSPKIKIIWIGYFMGIMSFLWSSIY